MRILLSGLFFFAYFLAYSQEYYANTREISVEDGLSHYRVLSFYPEEKGMWIGTEDGLDFFDGFQWQYWTHADGTLQANSVNFLLKDQEAYLWAFQTQRPDKRNRVQAIDLVNINQDTSISFAEKFGNQAPFALADIENFFQDQQQNLYFYAQDQLWQYTEERFRTIELPKGFSPLTLFSDGSFVGNYQHKLVVLAPTGEIIPTDYQFTDHLPYLLLGTQKQFWFWQKEKPCQEFKRSAAASYQMRPLPISPPKSTDRVLLHFEEQKGQLWVNAASGLQLLDLAGNVLFQHSINPKTACADHQGNLWTGGFNTTLLHLEKNRFKRYLHKSSKNRTLSDFYHCRGIVEQDKRLYVNTYDGLRIIDLAQDKLLPSPKDLGINFCFWEDQQEQLWLAYKQLIRFNPTNQQLTQVLSHEKGDPRIWSLYKDREDRMWLGGIGLSYLEEGKWVDFEQYNEFSTLAQAVILFFFKDKNGVIWVGSDRGLFQLDLEQGIIAAYNTKQSGARYLPSNKFQHMYQDDQGIFWLATANAGLLRWDKARGELQQFDKQRGMPSNNIYAVYEDQFDHLWMSSFHGLIRFKKADHSISVFHEEEGISYNEFNRISHYQAEDGRLYFGGQNGLTAFYPEDFLSIKSSKEKFALNVKHTSIFGLQAHTDTMPNGDAINLLQLGHSVRVIDLEMESADVFWTDRISLHYTLESLSDGLQTANISREKISSDNHVELFGLNPGNYHLQIKAIQKNGKQLGATIHIPIRIVPPIYHTPIFWVCFVLALGLSFWLYLKIKTTRLHKRQRELEILVNEKANQIVKDQQIIQNQAFQIESMQDQLNRKDELWLEQFCTIVTERLEDSNLGLPSIIEDLEMSRSSFYEKVRALTNMTPNQYIQELRLSKAKTLLESGQAKTVKEIAFAVGIKRPSYFSKLYKERYGILPSAYFRNAKSPPPQAN